MNQLSFKVFAILLIAVLSFYICRTRFAFQKGNAIFSWIVNVQYLALQYPIKSYNDIPPKLIPACPSDWSRKHGRIYRIWNGMNPEIVLTQPDDVKVVFKDSDMHTKAINNDAGRLMGELLGKCMGFVTGTEWRNVRASLEESFTHKSATLRISRITRLTEEYFVDLHNNGRLNGGFLNPTKDLRLLAFWIVADYLYGELTPAAKLELMSLIPLRESLFRKVIQGGLTRFSWSKHLPSDTNRDLKMFKAGWRKFNDTAYETCKHVDEKIPTVLMYESIQNDVTIGALSWNPIFLAANPTTQAQLREEIRGVRKEEWVEYISKSNTLLAFAVLESARLKPTAAFSIPQAAPETRVTEGFSVPGGTNFVVDTHSLNIRNPYEGLTIRSIGLLAFWTEKVRDAVPLLAIRLWSRQCLEKYLANMIIRVLVAHLLDHYQLTFTSTSKRDKDPKI
ncbi:putative cytochrome P450 monooxygenase [Biscogniauxia marginata]|nr:putative cytochrome P450 monooxygenase [Biscogniauxia marginata]